MKSFLFALWLLGLTAIGYSQQPPPLVDAEIRFISNEKISEVFIQPSRALPGRPPPKEEIKAGTHGRSDRIKYKGPPVLTVFSVSATAEGVEVRTPLTTVQLPLDKKEILVALIVSGQPGADRRYTAFAFDDGFASSPVGSLRILNLTPVPMFGRLGSKNIQIAAGVSMTESFLGAAAGRISIGYMVENQPMPVMDQAFEMELTDRLLVAILPPFARGSGAARARIIRDSAAPVAEPAPPARPRLN